MVRLQPWVLNILFIMKAIEIKNSKVNYEYFILDRYDAGIKLLGSEVKSIREKGANINQSYCYFKDGELFVKELFIPERKGSYTHNPNSLKKLLLKKKELNKLNSSLDKSLTIVPTKLYETSKGIIKLQIALVKGKKLWDKRETIKTRDSEKEIKRKFGK